jgi:histidinol dehydrogenase
MSFKAAPLRLSTVQADSRCASRSALHWSGETDAAIEQRVAEILADVQKTRRRGCAGVHRAL